MRVWCESVPDRSHPILEVLAPYTPRRVYNEGGHSYLIESPNEILSRLVLRDRKNNEVELGPIEVRVERDNVGRAMSQLKRMMAREGVLKEVKNRRYHEKPSVKEKRKRRDAERRRRKDLRKSRRTYR